MARSASHVDGFFNGLTGTYFGALVLKREGAIRRRRRGEVTPPYRCGGRRKAAG